MNRGYIKLWRASTDNDMYFCEPFTKWQAWCDLLLLANHKPRKVNVRGIMVTIGSGCVLAGENFLADRWKWSRGKVRRFLSYLESDSVQQIVQQKNNVCTVIAILKWENYQQDSTAGSTTNSTADGHQIVQQTDIPKNVKNVENKDKPKNKKLTHIQKALLEMSEHRKQSFILWLTHKKERNQSYKPTGFDAMVRQWADTSDADFRDAVEKSMAKNYSGIFEDKDKKTTTKAVPQRPAEEYKL